MLSVSCTVYRKGELRATRNVTVCEECFVQALVMGSRSKVPGKVFAALRERLSAVYNSMRAGDKMTRRRRTVRKFKAFTVYVGKNLSRDVAMSRFMRKTRRDWRGWSYNRKSGYVRAI